MLLSARMQYLALCRDEFGRHKVIERKTVLAHQPAEPTTKRKAGDSGRGYHAARNGQAMQLRFAVKFCPGHAALGLYCTAAPVGVNAFHERQVDHEPTLDSGSPCHVVCAAANRDLQPEFLSQIDTIDYVGHAPAASNESRGVSRMPHHEGERWLPARTAAPLPAAR